LLGFGGIWLLKIFIFSFFFARVCAHFPLFQCFCLSGKEVAATAMGKSGAPRKALCVKSGGKAPRKALCVKKVVKKGASKAKQKKDMLTGFDVFGSSDDSPSPTPPAPRSPRSPPRSPQRSPQRSPSHSPPHTPTYDRESWWDPVISLTRRMDAVAASMKDLQDRVKCLEDERVKLKAD